MLRVNTRLSLPKRSAVTLLFGRETQMASRVARRVKVVCASLTLIFNLDPYYWPVCDKLFFSPQKTCKYTSVVTLAIYYATKQHAVCTTLSTTRVSGVRLITTPSTLIIAKTNLSLIEMCSICVYSVIR